MQDDLLEKAREAEYEGNARKARNLFLQLARKYERQGDIVQSHIYEVQAEVYNDEKPMRFINE